jgi:hypothetical protein
MVKLYKRTITLLERISKLDDNITAMDFISIRQEAKDILEAIEAA